MIRIHCPYCHASLAPSELEQVTIQGDLGRAADPVGQIGARETHARIAGHPAEQGTVGLDRLRAMQLFALAFAQKPLQ